LKKATKIPAGGGLRITGVIAVICAFFGFTKALIGQTTLQLEVPFSDMGAGTTAAASTNTLGPVFLQLVNSAGMAADFHGIPGSGIPGFGMALDFSASADFSSGAGEGAAAGSGPLASVTSTALNYGVVTNFTATIWFNPNSVMPAGGANAVLGPRIFVLGANGTTDKLANNSIGLYFQQSNEVQATINTTAIAPTAGTTGSIFAPNQWYFFAITFDGTTATVYQGSETSPASVVATTTALAGQSINLTGGGGSTLLIGNRAGRDRPFDGWINDFRFYTGAATPTMVENIRWTEAGQPGMGGVNQLVNPEFDLSPAGFGWTTSGNTPFYTTNGGPSSPTYYNAGECPADSPAQPIITYPPGNLNVANVYGNFNAPVNYSYWSQTVPTSSGTVWTAGAWTYVSHEDLPGGLNSFYYVVSFLDGSGNLLSSYESLIVTNLTCGGGGTFPLDTWEFLPVTNQMQVSGGVNTGTVTATVPTGALTAPANAANVQFEALFANGNYAGGSVFFDNANLGIVGGTVPPAISPVTPNLIALCTNKALTCTASSSTGAITNIAVITQTSTLGSASVMTVTNTLSSPSLTVTGLGTSAAGVSFALASNTIYNSVIVQATDNSGSIASSGAVSFDTLSPALVVEASDFNYNGGQYIDTPPNGGLALYAGQVGQQGIDENKNPANSSTKSYRTGDAIVIQPAAPGSAGTATEQKFVTASANGDPKANDTTEMEVGYNSVGDWLDYTRDFGPGSYSGPNSVSAPPGTYNLYGYVATSGSPGPAVQVYQIAGAVNSGSQTVNLIGSLGLASATGNNWNAYEYLPLLDTYGNLVNITIPAGPQTFRTQLANNWNLGLYILMPVTGPVPITVLTNLPATSISSFAATLDGQFLSLQGYAPTVTFYYGTTDGGTNPANWSGSSNIGAVSGTFSGTIQGLTPNTIYFYTAQSVNNAGTNWASPSTSFVTTARTLALATNYPATSIGATVATLNGQVITTGGTPSGVILYYGTTDGSTNAGSWAHSVALGSQAGAYAQTASGLSSNTTYYFTAEATNQVGAQWSVPSLSFGTAAINTPSTLIPVLTYKYDNTRQGLNSNETQLTPANVSTGSFGRLFTYPVDGYVYAQPLIMTNVPILGKGTHNVLIVVTEHDSVYAFDADSNQGLNAAPLWKVSFINAAAGVTTLTSSDTGTSDIVPEIGMTATPVIDPATGTIYMEVKTKEVSGGVTSYVHRLHALDITTGLERVSGVVANSPVVINCTNYPGTGTSGYADNDGHGHVLFNTLREHSRCALTLLNGVLFLGYASHGDNQPYHGWLFAYDPHSLNLLSVFNSTPNGGLGGFWQGGGGATVDASGNFYWITGNGSFDATGSSFGPANSFAMSVLKFAFTNNSIVLTDYFSPWNEGNLSDGDADFGSGAALVLPDSAGSTNHPHLLVAGGKDANIYLINRDNLGHLNSTNNNNNQIVQTVNGGIGGSGSFSTPSFFNNTLYYIGWNSYLRAFKMSGGLLATTPTQSSTYFGDRGGNSPSITANGTNNGIVWALQTDGYSSSSPTILHAYNATNVAQELYNSSQNLTQDNPGPAVKFTVPTAVNGKVYVGAEYAVSVFGNATFVNAPVISPNGGSFSSSVSVTLSDTTPNATIFYTVDGTAPTTNSLLYSIPFTLTNSAEVQAVAVKPGAANSAVASAGFVATSAIGNGAGLLGNYWSNVTSTAFTNLSFNAPPTLTRTDAVINFNWTNTSPDPSVSPTNFTARWSGSVQAQFNETYTFSTLTDAGVLLRVNGQLLINKWVTQNPTTWTVSIPLKAQQRYNIEMEYFYGNQGSATAQLSWSSPSTPLELVPQSQLYPYSNPPPAVVLTNPANGATYTGTASVTVGADADAQYNSISAVNFYANTNFLGAVSNAPYTLTASGLGAGSYALTAVAVDGSGLSSTSAPMNITVSAGSGQPYGLTTNGTVPAFFNMPTTFNGTLPAMLSQTGVFSDTPNMAPVGGLVPYIPNTPLWSDGALKTRYLAVPNNGGAITPGEQITFAPTGTWTFPAGTVFVKTFSLNTDVNNPNVIHRLETRLLVRDINGQVYGVTYKWNTNDTDAVLLTNSLTENFTITNGASTTTQTWYYPSPADCLTCHTPVANYVLGLNTRQLNANETYPSTGVTDNELRALNRLGMLNPAINEAAIGSYEKLSALTNLSAPLVERSRSYLDANCAQCHQPGGTGITFDARYETPLTNQNMVNYPASFSLGYDHARIVAPQDVWRSVLYDRVNIVDGTNATKIQMPPLARNVIDTNALAVLAAWINSLSGIPALAPPVISPDGGNFIGLVNVSVQPPDTNAVIYYTLDGSLPTTNSMQYHGVIELTNGTTTVSANAFEQNHTNSVAASATFTVQPLYFASEGFTNQAFQLQFMGAPGSNYVLEATTNFTTWVPLSTNVAGTGVFNFNDTNARNFPYRFYRVIQQ
jgi:uncharacterized repeat protein (TIGR03806 family)